MGNLSRLCAPAAIAAALLAGAGCAHPNSGGDPHFPASATNSSDIEESGPPPPGSYAVRLPRHIKAGEAYDVRMLTTIDITMTLGDINPSVPPKVDHQVHEGEVSGRVDVSAVDQPNRKMDLVLTVGKFVSPDGKATLPTGSVVDIHGEAGKVRCTLRGGKLTDDAEKQLIGLGHLVDGGYSAMFHSTKYRKAGESWPIGQGNKDVKMSAGEFTVQAESPSGQATLKAVENVDGVSAMRVEGEMVIKLKPQDVLLGFRLGQSQTSFRMSALLPVDEQAQALEVDDEMDMDMHMSGNVLFRSMKTDVVTRQRVERKAIAK